MHTLIVHIRSGVWTVLLEKQPQRHLIFHGKILVCLKQGHPLPFHVYNLDMWPNRVSFHSNSTQNNAKYFH